jgi:hypothetical protein
VRAFTRTIDKPTIRRATLERSLGYVKQGSAFHMSTLCAWVVELTPENPAAILVWRDSIGTKDNDYFRDLRPWQIVNRIPSMDSLCRTAFFIYSIQRIEKHSPTLCLSFPLHSSFLFLIRISLTNAKEMG